MAVSRHSVEKPVDEEGVRVDVGGEVAVAHGGEEARVDLVGVVQEGEANKTISNSQI